MQLLNTIEDTSTDNIKKQPIYDSFSRMYLICENKMSPRAYHDNGIQKFNFVRHS
jgi:hypothetical protein